MRYLTTNLKAHGEEENLITYEINRLVGRYDNGFTRLLSAPGMWMQNFTTNEPDDSMIEVGIAAVQAVLPEEEGTDRW